MLFEMASHGESPPTDNRIIEDTGSAATHPEPNALTCPISHPLWATICHQCISLELPTDVQAAFLLKDVIGCRSSCCIAVSTKGRVLCQSHRCGFQLHGGGSRGEPLVIKAHNIHREQWMESNLDIANNPAVISRGHPILVMQDAWAFCLVQICILDDAQIEVTPQGVVWVGNVQLWSRERARDTEWYYERATEPTTEHIRAGQFYGDEPVMHVVQLDDIWTSPRKWRSCDWVTFAMLRERLEDMQKSHWAINDYPSQCVSFGDVSPDHFQQCEHIMSYWSVMKDVDRAQWPLLATEPLYCQWKDPAWRDATFREARVRYVEDNDDRAELSCERRTKTRHL